MKPTNKLMRCFIAVTLCRDKLITRKLIMEAFNLSTAQASKELKGYLSDAKKEGFIFPYDFAKKGWANPSHPSPPFMGLDPAEAFIHCSRFIEALEFAKKLGQGS